jgi:3-dehydroquinate synthase
MIKETCLPVKNNGKVIYDIYLDYSFAQLTDKLNAFDLSKRRICIVTDSNVNDLYREEVETLFSKIAAKVTVFVFPAGEPSKTLDTVRSLYEHLILEQFDRQDMLCALGGGVVGDLTGYAAATYLRGIDFIQVPTTLLACVDSSVGGKTGVDFDSYKNMVGAFYQPKLVYMNLTTLHTLSSEQFACGMAEIIKYGLIKDAKFYKWMIEHRSDIENKDLSIIEQMILTSCKIKRDVVEKDFMEKGERALLNFGHTIGHAVEKLKNGLLLHGQCVALGSVAAAYISYKRNYLTEDEFYEIRDINAGFELPVVVDNLAIEDILLATKSDKKMDAGQIKFILLKSLGHGIIDDTVTDAELQEAVKFIVTGIEEES